MIERDVFEYEIATKEIDWEFITLDSLDELAEAVDDDFFDDSFDHWSSF